MTYDERLQKFHTDDLLPSEERLQKSHTDDVSLPRIWVVTRHQYGIFAIVYQMCLPGKMCLPASKFWAVFAIVQIVNRN